MHNFVKIRPVGPEMLHADGRTDRTMVIIAFRKFANAPKHKRTECICNQVSLYFNVLALTTK